MTTSSKKTPNAIPKRIMAHAVLFGVVVSVVAPGTPAGAKAKKPKLSAKKVTVTEGKTKTIKLSRAGKKAKVTWKTSNKKAVKVSKKTKTSCKIKGVKKGTATVSCSVRLDKKTYKLKCKVTVAKKKIVNAPSILAAYKDIIQTWAPPLITEVPLRGNCAKTTPWRLSKNILTVLHWKMK